MVGEEAAGREAEGVVGVVKDLPLGRVAGSDADDARVEEPVRGQQVDDTLQRLLEIERDALEAQLGALIPRVASLTQEQQQAVQGIAVAELTRAQQRLAEYQTQARFALAQLYDRASLATNSTTKEAGDAPRR